MDMINELSDLQISEIGQHYHIASQLRQSRDFDWIIELLPDISFDHVMDVCCGSGKFLKQLLDSGKIDKFAHGIDASPSMIKTAHDQLQTSHYEIPIRIQQADILHPPEFSAHYNLITMLSAIHWLYPHEKRVHEWISRHLSKDGYFCVTSYHPRDYKYGYGGTDWLVLDALERISLTREFSHEVIPIGTRTRPIHDMKHILCNDFDIVHSSTKEAKMTVDNAAQYMKYHWATFGDYYIKMVPDLQNEPFLNVLGEVAMERMESIGYVTNMDVYAHVCRLK